MPRVAAIRVELLGGCRVVLDGTAIVRPLSARQQQLLACLVLAGEPAISRALVAGRLWPDSTDTQALTNLRREWHHLRDTWPEIDGALDAGARVFTWRGPAPVSDVALFTEAADRGLKGDRERLETAATLYRGDLLPDCRDEWLDADRERLRQLAVRVLTTLVAEVEATRSLGDAIARAQQLLRLDPLNEPAWCALMRSHARRGERATALHLYQQCAAILKRELAVSPGAVTRATYREILDLDEDIPAPAVAPTRPAVFPLVGRKAEWSALLESSPAATGAPARLVVVEGEAGIGKSRLVEELVARRRAQDRRVAVTRCYAAEGRLAYAPIAAWLQSDAVAPALTSLDTLWAVEIARLRPEVLTARADVAAPDAQLEPWQRTRFFEALAHAFQHAAPLLLVVDDLQWADADTLEWLHYFLRADTTSGCTVVATLRSEEAPDNQSVGALMTALDQLSRLTKIALGRLDEADTVRLAEEVAGHPLREAARSGLFGQTEGHPLFVVEHGRMSQTDGAPDRSPRVQAIVAARLAHLPPGAREVAEVASAIGRDFSFDVLADVSDLEEGAVVRALDELWCRNIVRVQDGERWDFSHDRIREVAYSEIGPARRRLLHRRIARALERIHAADRDPVSAAIAAHLERGGQPAAAIPFLERAADLAARQSATEEAIRCLTHALTLVDAISAGRDRDGRELGLRTTLLAPLTSARGYAAQDVQENLERIVALATAINRGQVPVHWLWGLWSLHFVRGDFDAARASAEQAMAASLGDPSGRCEAHHAMAGTLLGVGALVEARGHFEAALAAHDDGAPARSVSGTDLAVFIRAHYAHVLCLVGEPDAAAQQTDAAIARAERLGHPFSQLLALAYAAITHQMRDDVGRVEHYAAAVLALSERHGFAYYDDWARILLGWTRGRTGDAAMGVGMIEHGLRRLDAQRAMTRRPYYLSLLAETLIAAGNRTEALSVLRRARTIADAGRDRWWLPEVLRQLSDLQLSERESLRQEALETARAQGNRALERRLLDV